MRWIYISPHFDDVVLSCGGLIWEQTQKGVLVEIWTVCAGVAPPGPLSRLAKEIHKEWSTRTAEETVLLRRAEDREATSCVGAGVFHFGTPDCIYRRSPRGILLYTAGVFTPWNPLEKDLPEEIATALSARLQPDDVLVCPLAIGGHVDHMLTRWAVESLRRPLLYYADIPYLLYRPKSLTPVPAGLDIETHPVSGKGLRAWLVGIAAYSSQITMLFKTSRRMRVAISRYWESMHGVRFWRVE
jgi:LmbE family N-acetylglucosaminyl deacetylase